VINGIIAVPVMATMMLLASRRTVMGKFKLRPIVKTLGWAATALMSLAAIGMFATVSY
jgi:Mn2+/Fe2+ NRAMP family transporter